jgi:hypothetical protein
MLTHRQQGRQHLVRISWRRPQPAAETIFLTTVRAALGHNACAHYGGLGADTAIVDNSARTDVDVHYACWRRSNTTQRGTTKRPAWLVFGAFFMVVPLSPH